jgi:HD-like signal output (HDOD) protein
VSKEPSEAVLDPALTDSVSGVVAVAGVGRRRILFVDDEPSILEGLRAALRPQRREWDASFALGGSAGLEEVRRNEFDVVITDMRMPVIDGAEVLRQVKDIQPRAVRFVLSGQTDTETAMRTVFTAHQFLAKPCDIDQLRALVRRACSLNELVCADELRALAGETSLLPAAPRSYMAISSALASPTCSLSTVAGIVERDPALCAKVLQVVNSAFFGLPRKISSVAQAASLLGTLTLKNLALAMESLAAAKRASQQLSTRQLLGYQTNALLGAMLGRRWFGADRRRGDEAFVAGMLRDMGHLLLAVSPQRVPVPESDAHAALSAYLLGLWGLPHAVLEPVAFHEHPERVEHDAVEVVDVVHLADRLAAEVAPSPFQPAPPPPDLERLARLGATAEQIDELRRETKVMLHHAQELLRA